MVLRNSNNEARECKFCCKNLAMVREERIQCYIRVVEYSSHVLLDIIFSDRDLAFLLTQQYVIICNCRLDLGAMFIFRLYLSHALSFSH